MAGQQRIRLSVVNGEMEGVTAEFPPKKKVTIGRIKSNAFQIKHETVSQRHAFLVNKDGRWLLTDADSSNGTFLNGVAAEPNCPVEVKNGDLLKIGLAHEVRLTICDAEGEVPAPGHGKLKNEIPRPEAAARKANSEIPTREAVTRKANNEVPPPEAVKGVQQEKENAPKTMTLEDWYEDCKRYLAEINTTRSEDTIRGLVEHAEVLKRKINRE